MKKLLILFLGVILLSSCASTLPIEHPAYRTPKQCKSLRKFASLKRKRHNVSIFRYGYINHPAVKKDTRKMLRGRLSGL